MRITRRTFGSLALGTAMAGATRPGFAQESRPSNIMFNGAGGAQEEGVKAAFLDPFTAETGIPVVTSSPADFGKLRVMVETDSVIWDLTELGGQDILRAQEMDLLEPIDETIVDRSKFVPEAVFTHALSAFVYSTVIGYNKDTFAEGPKDWADFWDFDKFPGQRSMRSHPTVNLEAALLADGVNPKDLYPLDLDRAFKKLDEIADKTIWWTAGAQPPQSLLDGEVALATGWNGRFFTLMQEGAPLAISWGQGALLLGGVGIPRGAPNVAWAQKVLAYMANPKCQAEFGASQAYSGTHKEAGDFMPAEIATHLPLHPENARTQWWVDLQWWLENGDATTERWNAWMLSRQR